MAHGWAGDKVRLVAMDQDRHFENLLRWVNDTDLTATLYIGDFPVSRTAQEAWFARVTREDEQDVVFAIETLEGRHIGTTGIHRIDYRHGTAETGLYIGEDVRGQGYGTDACRVRARYCFKVLGLRLLMTSYMGDNVASRRMLEKAGYREIGVWPKRYWKRGSYLDEHLMALDRATWEGLDWSTPTAT
jgi:RimJ/RimL family protein N-acetyltransferase